MSEIASEREEQGNQSRAAEMETQDQSFGHTGNTGNTGNTGDPAIGEDRESPKPRNRKRRYRTNWMLLALMVGLLIAFSFYVFALPLIEGSVFRLQNPTKKSLPSELQMKWSNRTMLRSCEFLFLAWFFYLGASIGSFLNVVAWRVPEGRTIVFGGSKCPFCDSRLSFIDNTPVLGWIVLQGRCRTCRLPIAPRYLMIEIAVGGVFMWLALWQLVRGGINLPSWNGVGRTGLVNIVLDPPWPLIGIYLVHVAMFGVLIMLATANGGRKPFPVLAMILIGLGLASSKIVNPSFDLIAWHLPFSKHGLSNLGPLANPAFSVLIGGAAGWLVGWLSSWMVARRFGAIVARHWTLQCFLVGTVLGWQSVLTIVVVSLSVYGISRTTYRLNHSRTSNSTLANQALRLNACFIIVALVHHSFWFQIAHLLGLS